MYFAHQCFETLSLCKNPFHVTSARITPWRFNAKMFQHLVNMYSWLQPHQVNLSPQIIMPNIKAVQPKHFIEKLFLNEVLIRVKKFISNLTMCQVHKVFRNIIVLPLTFLNHKHLRCPLMKSKPFLTISSKHEDSNSILLSSVHRWISEVCILTSILWIDKLLWTVSHTSPRFHFHQMEILLSSMFHIS